MKITTRVKYNGKLLTTFVADAGENNERDHTISIDATDAIQTLIATAIRKYLTNTPDQKDPQNYESNPQPPIPRSPDRSPTHHDQEEERPHRAD